MALTRSLGRQLAPQRAGQHVDVDETGWREQTRRCRLWVAVGTLVTVFLLRPSRGSRLIRVRRRSRPAQALAGG